MPLYPYCHTVRNGNQTIYTVTNHTDRHKIVRVQMSEGRNGRNVLSFNVMLSHPTTAGRPRPSPSPPRGNDAKLLPGDSSCTYPRFEEAPLPDGRYYQSLLPFDYTGSRRDAGPTGYDRMREGYIKIFELATVVPETPPAIAMTPAASGAPPGCASIVEAYESGYWAQDLRTHLTNPTGGLSGEAMVLNVAAGTVMAYQATALADFRTDPADVPRGSRATVLNHSRGVVEVGLDDALSDPATGFVTATIDLPNRRQDLVYPRERAIDAVSAVLAADSVNINYVSDASVGATTDWVVTFPTRPYYTDQAIVGAAAVKPFTSLYPSYGGIEATAAMPVPYSLRDRDGRRVLDRRHDRSGRSALQHTGHRSRAECEPHSARRPPARFVARDAHRSGFRQRAPRWRLDDPRFPALSGRQHDSEPQSASGGRRHGDARAAGDRFRCRQLCQRGRGAGFAGELQHGQSAAAHARLPSQYGFLQMRKLPVRRRIKSRIR